MSTSLLAQVRNVARRAAKSGSGWKIRKGGTISCENDRCTLAAIIFKQTEPMREIQEEFAALIKKANKVARGRMNTNFSSTDEVFDDSQVYSDDGWPGEYEAAAALDLDNALTALVIRANDNSRKQLEREVEMERREAEAEKELGIITSINDYEPYTDGVRALKARIILEEELIGKGK